VLVHGNTGYAKAAQYYVHKDIASLVLFLGTFDFFGLNHYSTNLATAGTIGESPSLLRDTGVQMSWDPSWPSSASYWLKVRQQHEC
jgi:hypothetical protein